MSHNGVTQNDSDDMPKVLHTIRRNGVYHFNARYPTHLVGNLTNGQTMRRFSLKTKVWKEAKAKAARAYLEFQLETEELDRTWEKQVAKEPSGGIDYSNISEDRKRKILLDWFIQREREVEEYRNELSSKKNEERLSDALLDFGSLESLEESPMREWIKHAQQILKAQDIQAAPDQLNNFAALLRKGSIEVQRRTLEVASHFLPSSNPANTLASPYFEGFYSHSPRPNLAPERSITDLCEKYDTDKRKTRIAPGTLEKYSVYYRILNDFYGPKKSLNSIDVEQAQALTEFLSKIPLHATQRYPNVPLKEAAIREAKKAKSSYLAAKTQKDHHQGISTIFRHAQELEWISTNPFSRKTVTSLLPQVKKKTIARFTDLELTKIFSSEAFLNNRHHSNYYPRFWIPILCCLHGFRSNEPSQLLVDDIVTDHHIPHFLIRVEDETGKSVKRLKNVASQRQVPINELLIKIGFLDFVDAQRSASEKWLFPTLKVTKRGSRADAIGKWFSRFKNSFLEEKQAARSGKTLHSLRHAFTRAGRDYGINDSIMDALGGWTAEKKNSRSDYGDGFSLETLQEALNKLCLMPPELASVLTEKTDGEQK